MAGMRKRVTSRFRSTDIFSARFVISVPRMGAVLIAAAILLAVKNAIAANVVSVVALVCAAIAIVTTMEARHQLRTFKFDMVERTSRLIAAYQIPDEDIRIAHELGLLDPDEDEDDAPFIRISHTS